MSEDTILRRASLHGRFTHWRVDGGRRRYISRLAARKGLTFETLSACLGLVGSAAVVELDRFQYESFVRHLLRLPDQRDISMEPEGEN